MRVGLFAGFDELGWFNGIDIDSYPGGRGKAGYLGQLRMSASISRCSHVVIMADQVGCEHYCITQSALHWV
jgi:hypothetical protein